ncbi:hypothetical protein FEM48_Zijuj02G0112500 [Ziziphus jujuba var. spinosa]|uniref:Spermidine coumaroyl-CoA acyltransferase-like n=1 Tax=Ziziphus jujuba var. spinosa TaxID=714518 RepID=A0A978VVE7_ZIZJJ|nr:hypothetical protein FEM48_Zijuj02G0112500 [Ziziphus jujuba var. spinosa]
METKQTTPLLIERREVELVKPTKPTPSDVLSFSTIDHDPNLEKLFPRYPLAGKLRRDSDGNLRITCKASGVPFLVAEADCQLSSLHYLEGIDVETLNQFVFGFPSHDDPAGEHPLFLQVTKFTCGGFAIGVGVSHSVCDGARVSQFLRTLSELSMGKILEPTVKPVWERERLTGKIIEAVPLHFPIDESSSATSPYLPASELSHGCFYVTSESIKRLKMRFIKEMMDRNEVPRESFTTVEVLGGFVWRARFRALKLNPDGKTLFCLTTGIRKHLVPPLPDGYYGNAFVPSNFVVMGKELNEEPLPERVKLIKQSKKTATQNVYIRNVIDILETTRKQNKKTGASGASMVLTDWRQLNLMETEFGPWEAVNMVPVPWNIFGYVDLCLFLPPPNLDPAMKGGVRVLVSLPRSAMPKFKEEMDSLKLGNDDDNSVL